MELRAFAQIPRHGLLSYENSHSLLTLTSYPISYQARLAQRLRVPRSRSPPCTATSSLALRVPGAAFCTSRRPGSDLRPSRCALPRAGLGSLEVKSRPESVLRAGTGLGGRCPQHGLQSWCPADAQQCRMNEQRAPRGLDFKSVLQTSTSAIRASGTSGARDLQDSFHRCCNSTLQRPHFLLKQNGGLGFSLFWRLRPNCKRAAAQRPRGALLAANATLPEGNGPRSRRAPRLGGRRPEGDAVPAITSAAADLKGSLFPR